jgi:hypothetical protein
MIDALEGSPFSYETASDIPYLEEQGFAIHDDGYQTNISSVDLDRAVSTDRTYWSGRHRSLDKTSSRCWGDFRSKTTGRIVAYINRALNYQG